jgi:hypothetical protein
MKQYLVRQDGRYMIARVSGFSPQGVICELPDENAELIYPFIINTNGNYSLCMIKLSAWMKEQIKNANQ